MRRREVIQDVALLLLERRDHRHHALDKARAVLALGAKAALAPLHTRTDCAFGRIVRGLHPCDLHEGPQRLAPLENLLTGPLVLATPHWLPTSRSRSTSRRSGVMYERNVERANVPSRTRCHQVNIWCACSSRASPIVSETPPRPRIASKSRSKCAQHT